MPRSQAKVALKTQALRVNGEAADWSRRVAAGDVLSLAVETRAPSAERLLGSAVTLLFSRV